MQLDVNALGTFYRMASEGAGLAAGRLTQMTDVETRVGVTRLNFIRGSEIRTEFGDTEKVAVRMQTESGLEGDTMVVFERENALRVVRTLLPEDASADDEFDDLNRSAVTEVGQIMNSGFIDGWADVLETAIDLSPPEFVMGQTADDFLTGLDNEPDDDDLVVLFRSQINAVDTEVGFNHYFFPARDSIADLIDRLREPDAPTIDFDKLEGFDRMAEQGAEAAADHITTMTGIETDVEIRRLNFVSLEAIPQEVAERMLVGVAFEYEGTPSGYLVFMFDEDSAAQVAEAMLPTAPEDPLSDLGQSAIQELGNIMASGFLDGWANVLDTTIDHSTPEYIHDTGAAAIDPMVIQLGENQDYAFVFDTHIEAADRDIDCEVFSIPDEEDLMRALNDLEVERVDEAPTEAEFPVDDADEAESSIESDL